VLRGEAGGAAVNGNGAAGLTTSPLSANSADRLSADTIPRASNWCVTATTAASTNDETTHTQPTIAHKLTMKCARDFSTSVIRTVSGEIVK